MMTTRDEIKTRIRKVIIWGAGADYQSLYNIIKYEELKGNIDVVAIADKHAWQDKIDGYKAIHPQEIKEYPFDYVIISPIKYYNEIILEASEMGINRECLIKGNVLQIPCFDFKDYALLRENPVSIISDTCWGGRLYHYLDLPFTSPFINFWISDSDFVKMANNLKCYLSRPLNMELQGDMYTEPIGSLEIENEKVLFHFTHHNTFEDARKDFERRRNRINWNNLFIKMHYCKQMAYMGGGVTEDSVENVAQFDTIPYDKKICLTQFRMETLTSFQSVLVQNAFVHDYPKWNRNTPRNIIAYSHTMETLAKEYNIFQLLLTGKKIARFKEKELA